MRTAAIIPVFNNDRTVGDVIRKTREYVDAIIVVDDGSTDGTPEALQKLAKRGHCTVLTHQKNLGKGEALRTAVRHLRNKRNAAGLEAVVFLDADGEHNPEEIPQFLNALKTADLVLGARTSHRSRGRALMNRWMAFWFKLVNQGISDPSCGFRAVRWEVLKRLELRSPDFCIDAEIVLEAVKARASITSIRLSTMKHACSSVRREDFIRINNFFDTWLIRNARSLKLSNPKRFLLGASARVGKTLGTPLLKQSIRNV